MLENPHVALLFFIPGVTDTFRVNGRATIVTDPELLDVSGNAARLLDYIVGLGANSVGLCFASRSSWLTRSRGSGWLRR